LGLLDAGAAPPWVPLPPIDANDIRARTRRFGTFSSGFRTALGDELGNQVAISPDVAGNDTLRLSEPFLWRFGLHNHFTDDPVRLA
jgi:hypothetical protein